MLALATLTSFPFPSLRGEAELAAFHVLRQSPGEVTSPLSPLCPVPGPGPELGPAEPGSPRLLCSSGAQGSESGGRGEGREEGRGEMKL